MPENRGKQFEKAIKESFLKIPKCFIYRLQDSMGGYSGVANICDFFIYKEPQMYAIECKSCHDNKWYFDRLSKNQYEGLLDAAKYGIEAGVLLWFIDKDITCYISIDEIRDLKESGENGIRFNDDLFYIRGTKKRVLFEYDMREFLDMGGKHGKFHL